MRETIKAEAEKRGLTNYKLAKLAGLQQTQVRKYLEGSADLKGHNIEKLLSVLNLSLAYRKQGKLKAIDVIREAHKEKSIDPADYARALYILTIVKDCHVCLGYGATKEDTGEEIPCALCSGDGFLIEHDPRNKVDNCT